jgi:hypothetical protein
MDQGDGPVAKHMGVLCPWRGFDPPLLHLSKRVSRTHVKTSNEGRVCGDLLLKKLMNQILLGAAALCWVIWLNINDMCFNNVKPNTFMLIIFRATY